MRYLEGFLQSIQVVMSYAEMSSQLMPIGGLSIALECCYVTYRITAF